MFSYIETTSIGCSIIFNWSETSNPSIMTFSVCSSAHTSAVDILTIKDYGDVELSNAIKIGDIGNGGDNPGDGIIKYVSNKFQGLENGEWYNLINPTDVKLLTVSTPYDVIGTEYIIHCSGDTIHNINVPYLGNINGREITVKDSSLNAATYNKIILQASGKVEGQSSGYTMSTDGESVTFYCYNGDLFIKSVIRLALIPKK